MVRPPKPDPLLEAAVRGSQRELDDAGRAIDAAQAHDSLLELARIELKAVHRLMETDEVEEARGRFLNLADIIQRLHERLEKRR